MNLNFAEWGQFFKFTKQFCIQNKLKQFHYKFLHRIMVTKKELCRSGIKQDIITAYTVEMKIPSNTLLLTVSFQNLSRPLKKSYLDYFPPLHLQTNLC